MIQVQQAATGPPKYSGPLDVVKSLWKEGGIRSIYRGTCATLLRGESYDMKFCNWKISNSI